jgi:hypothetical protein
MWVVLGPFVVAEVPSPNIHSNRVGIIDVSGGVTVMLAENAKDWPTPGTGVAPVAVIEAVATLGGSRRVTVTAALIFPPADAVTVAGRFVVSVVRAWPFASVSAVELPS